MKKEEIELSPVEATSYWWINSIKYKVREIAISGTNDKSEAEFLEIFYNYTEINWRQVYLELVKYIFQDVASYIPKSHHDSFSQDTAIKGHTKINDEISKIINQRIPDIRLASNNTKDSVIYTTPSFSSVWYKSCGVHKLPTKYEPSYILTGDNKMLDFYNLLISTIAVLDKKDDDFESISILREKFCSEYIRLSDSEENLNNVIEMFNFSFNKANDNGIILGRSFQETYFSSFRDIDYIGLNSYVDLANHYANIVLQETKGDDETTSYSSLVNKIDSSKLKIYKHY